MAYLIRQCKFEGLPKISSNFQICLVPHDTSSLRSKCVGRFGARQLCGEYSLDSSEVPVQSETGSTRFTCWGIPVNLICNMWFEYNMPSNFAVAVREHLNKSCPIDELDVVHQNYAPHLKLSYMTRLWRLKWISWLDSCTLPLQRKKFIMCSTVSANQWYTGVKQALGLTLETSSIYCNIINYSCKNYI